MQRKTKIPNSEEYVSDVNDMCWIYLNMLSLDKMLLWMQLIQKCLNAADCSMCIALSLSLLLSHFLSLSLSLLK